PETALDCAVLLAVFLRRPHEQDGDADHDEERDHHVDDAGGETVHASSASGKLRCRRGGTRKFWRCVVRRIELNPWLRSRGASGSLPSGRTPSIASRLRWKSSLDGLKVRK